MKRKICSIFMILMAFVLILGFNSCDEEPGDDGDSGGDSGCASVGHTWVDADCDNPKTCSVCQATEGEKLGHDYTEKVSDQAHQKTASASCTVKDTYWYDCSRCDKNAKDDPSATQKYYEAETAGAHNVDQMWSIENGEHFRKCLASGCNYVTDKAACSGGVATCSSKAVCQTCNSEYGSFGDHDYDLDAWGYKGQDGHAHNCKYCIAHDTVLPHTPNVDVPTEQTAKICTTSGCGYVIETVIHDHTPSSEFEYDNTHHWHDCVYNDEQIYGKETHSFDNACDTTCNGGCGYTRSIQHSYTVTDKNETQHW